MKKIHLLFIPQSNKNNKYIDLLLNNLPYDSNFVKGDINIVHVHWSTTLYGSKYAIKSLYLMKKNFLIYVYLKIRYNIKVVWTIHNNFAHDYPHPWIDQLGRKLLRKIADKIIVQQKSSLKFGDVYIPHVNYIDAYGPKVSRDIALRRSLGVADGDILLVSLGVQAPYKLNEKIVDAVLKTKNIKLLIIGKGHTNRESSDRIIIKNEFIKDEDMPRYLSIADYSIFYYDASEMTSGGMILSLSYGVPVITRNIPAAEIINGRNGMVYESFDEVVSILSTLKIGFYDTIDSVKAHSPEYISNELKKLYESLG